MDDLLGRVALVTGASRGIGRAAALTLARSGCHVVVGYQRRADLAAEVVREIASLGRTAIAVAADLSREDEVEALAAAVGRQFVGVDVLVNNAGAAHPRSLDELTVDDFDREIAVNLRSAFLVTRAFLPGMRTRRWGRLIYVSSVAAQVGGVVGPHYAASKAALHGLAHGYAAQLAGEGITANVVAPALIDTDMVRNNPRARPDLIPVGRFGTPEEVADVIALIAANGYLNGQTVSLNGGWYPT